MIPRAFITEWSQQVPWQTNEQTEQDLVICRALAEIFSDEFLGDTTALLKTDVIYKPHEACELIRTVLIEKI